MDKKMADTVACVCLACVVVALLITAILRCSYRLKPLEDDENRPLLPKHISFEASTSENETDADVQMARNQQHTTLQSPKKRSHYEKFRSTGHDDGRAPCDLADQLFPVETAGRGKGMSEGAQNHSKAEPGGSSSQIDGSCDNATRQIGCSANCKSPKEDRVLEQKEAEMGTTPSVNCAQGLPRAIRTEPSAPKSSFRKKKHYKRNVQLTEDTGNIGGSNIPRPNTRRASAPTMSKAEHSQGRLGPKSNYKRSARRKYESKSDDVAKEEGPRYVAVVPQMSNFKGAEEGSIGISSTPGNWVD